MILLMESDLTLWKDREYNALIPARVSTSWYRNWIYVGSSPTERAILIRESKEESCDGDTHR